MPGEGEVQERGGAGRDKNAVAIEGLEENRRLIGPDGVKESRDARSRTQEERQQGGRSPSGISPSLPVEFRQFQMTTLDDPVFEEQNPANGPQQRTVATEPGEDVGAGVRKQLPRHHQNAQAARDHATGTEGDPFGRQVAKVVGWGNHICGEVCSEGGDREGQHGNDHDQRSTLSDSPGQDDGVPDWFFEDDHGRRGDSDSDEGVGCHSRRKTHRLTQHLVFLGAGEAGEVRDVQRECGPERNVGGQARRERCHELRPSGQT